MAKNYVQPGDTIELVAPYARNSGEGALVGSVFGVALTDLLNAAVGEFAVVGVWDLAKVSTQEWTQGAMIYWDNSAKLCTTTAGGNTLIGTAMAATVNPSATGRVRLSGVNAGLSTPGTGAVVAALTDNSGGATADSTIAATTAGSVLSIPISLAAVADGDVLTTFTPGFAGKILRVVFAVTSAVTTADKATSLNLEIGTTNVTGGVVALTSANCATLGAVVAGSAVTAANVFSASDTLSIEAASTTAFAEGAGVLLVTIDNTVVADSIKELATKINAVLTSLKDASLMASS